MTKIPLTIRVETCDLEGWTRQANVRGLNLSEWIRRTLNRNGENNSDVPRVEGVRVATRRTMQSARSTAEAEIDKTVHEYVGRVTEQVKGTKTCEHGTAKGYHCWRCGGMAMIP